MSASANAQANVVKYLQQKQEIDYEAPTYLGVDQRFIAPIRGIGNNIKNFEEQYLIGTDTYTVQKIDENGDEITIKSFTDSNPGVTEKFYQLKTIKYKNPESGGTTIYEFDDENQKVIMPSDGGTTAFAGYNLICSSTSIYKFEDNTLKIYPKYSMKTQQDILTFVKSNDRTQEITGSNSVVVLTKDTYKRYESSTELVTQEIITRGKD